MMHEVRAKKHLGQHFLTDQRIAADIAHSLECPADKILEIGPGMGVLTQFLIDKYGEKLHLAEIDQESVEYLKNRYPELGNRLIVGDVLNMNLREMGEFSIIGNFPYNISSQIIFKLIEYKDQVPELAGMFQKEVAERLVAKPGSKVYGILSVLLQAWYSGEYLFTVPEHVFNPPPKVKSGVVRFKRKTEGMIASDPKLFKNVVKTAFNQRRKTLRNSLRIFNIPDENEAWQKYVKLRPEQLSVADFDTLTQLIKSLGNQ